MRVLIISDEYSAARLKHLLVARALLEACEIIPEPIEPPDPRCFVITGRRFMVKEPPVIKLTQPKSYFPPRKGKRGKLKKW